MARKPSERDLIHDSASAVYAALRELYQAHGLDTEAADELASVAAAASARAVGVVLGVEPSRRR